MHLHLDELEHALKVTKPSWILTVSGLLGTVNEAKKNAGSEIRVSTLSLMSKYIHRFNSVQFIDHFYSPPS